MRKLLSVLFSTLQRGVRGGLLFVALLATTTLWAQRFQVGDLYYQVVNNNDEMVIPHVNNPGYGRTTVVLYIPENTPAGCYAVGTVNGWDINNTDLMFTPVADADNERWVACTFDYAEDMQIKVCAIPSDPTVALSWSYQWGKNMDPENDLVEDNVVILDGSTSGYLELENQGQPNLFGLENDGVVYIEIKDWATNPIIEPVPCETAAFKHPWGGGDWVYREATKTAEGIFELNAIYGNNGVNIATDVTGADEFWYPTDQIEFVGDIAIGDSVNFKFISEKRTIGRMIVTLIKRGKGSNDNPLYVSSKKSPTTQHKRSNTDAHRQVVVTYQHEWSSENYHYLTKANIPATIEYRGQTYEVIGISENAFANSHITSVTIPNSIKSIARNSFADCKLLTTVKIPESVTSIGIETFSGCLSLLSITIPNSVTQIGGKAFYNTGIYNNDAKWDNSALYISNCLVATKEEMVGGYVVKDGTRLIAEDAFYDCNSLTSVTLPNSVTHIVDGAFWSCDSLMSVTIGSGVVSIGYCAFDRCYALDQIYCYSIIPPTVNDWTFRDDEEYTYRYYATLYVPEKALLDYKVHDIWGLFANIVPMSTTAVENTQSLSPMTNCQKIIRNGQLLIFRDGVEYTVMGQEL